LAVVVALVASSAGAAIERPTYLGPKPGAVRRVVTLAPSLTDFVLALGAGDRLVGVSRFDERPEVKKLERVGGFVDPSVEAVLALKADLVLVQPAPGNKAPVEKMAELGVSVLVLPMHSVASTLEAIREVGRALGLREKAEAIVNDIEATRARVRASARSLPRRRVLVVYGYKPLVVAGPGSFAVELLEDAGGVNAAADAGAPFAVYSAEAAMAARPEVVIDAADTSRGKETYLALPGLKQARWVKPASKELLQPGPGLGRGLEALFLAVHPDRGGL
jgi:iron complex transport system substrate-binding protein